MVHSVCSLIEPRSIPHSMLNHVHCKALNFSTIVLCSCGVLLCLDSTQNCPTHSHLDTHAFSPWTIYCSQIEHFSVSYAFLMPRIWVRFFLFGHLITLVYWLCICLYMIKNCKFQGLLASSQARSALCPMAHSQYRIFLSHCPTFSYSAFPPTSGNPYIIFIFFSFPFLKGWLYPLPSTFAL